MTVLWWHWLVLGLLLLVAEVAAAGGFYVVFFGIGALIVGALAASELVTSLPAQGLLFVALSVGLLALFRSRLVEWLQRNPQSPPVDALVGEVGTVGEDLAPGAVGRIELRGTAWSARNDANVTLTRGVRCRVIRVEGLTLHIEPEGVR